jgi:argininosuccinate lyase
MYVATCAERVEEEPKRYTMLRLVEILERLALLGSHIYGDFFLQEIAGEIRRKKECFTENNEELHMAVEKIIVALTAEAGRLAEKEG